VFEAAVSQLVKIFPALHGTQMFVTVFTTEHHYSYPEPDQTNQFHPVLFVEGAF
jgi:hypothetical protein